MIDFHESFISREIWFYIKITLPPFRKTLPMVVNLWYDVAVKMVLYTSSSKWNVFSHQIIDNVMTEQDSARSPNKEQEGFSVEQIMVSVPWAALYRWECLINIILRKMHQKYFRCWLNISTNKVAHTRLLHRSSNYWHVVPSKDVRCKCFIESSGSFNSSNTFQSSNTFNSNCN